MNEFDILKHMIGRDKERLITRLAGQLKWDGQCLLWGGATNWAGYGLVNFRSGVNNKHVQFKAHRLFLTLRLCRPIAKGMEAGHTCGKSGCVVHVIEQTRQENLHERKTRRKEKSK